MALHAGVDMELDDLVEIERVPPRPQTGSFPPRLPARHQTPCLDFRCSDFVRFPYNLPMNYVPQEEPTGCLIAAVAMILDAR
jgi:hypothetical protein